MLSHMLPFKPYASQAQERLFNSKMKPSGISEEDVEGKNKVSKGKSLPSKIGGSIMLNKKHFAGKPNG